MSADPRGDCAADVRARLAEIATRWAEAMSAGRFRAAWQLSDAALAAQRGIDCSTWPRHEQFIWDGTPVEGRRVLVRCYRGYGDTVQMARFLPRLRQKACHVTVWAPALLHPLLRQIGGADRLETLHDGDPGIDCDVDLEICELAHVFRVGPGELRGCVPYLHVGASPRSLSSGNTRAPGGEVRLGIVWQSGDWDPRRSISWPALMPLGQVPGVHWSILQRGPGLQTWGAEFGELPRIDDVMQEARCLAGLDLLVSVDTFSAHLAGALGVPVWLLLPAQADWRWRMRGSRTPWYPSMRLWRQRESGEWAAVLARVRRALTALARDGGRDGAAAY